MMDTSLSENYLSLYILIGNGVETKDSDTRTCIPLVSEYTDCTPDNECTGCTKCSCSPAGRWQCQSVRKCDSVQVDKIDEELFDAAIDKLDYDLKIHTNDNQNEVPRIQRQAGKKDISHEILDMMSNYFRENNNKRTKRATIQNKNAANKHDKRSTEKKPKQRPTRNSNDNSTAIKFYSTVDELNEDTLKNSNASGTIKVKKVELKTKQETSRRANDLGNTNKSLHIDFNHPKANMPITDNKIDTPDQENKVESSEKLMLTPSNYTQKTKDKELSKVVVNELKSGSEVIGDKGAPVTSNITFTSENDTLTAMAFIAGNLLKKLWNMEKDATGFSWETEDMKQEKISDLLDLFKEPLNLRQETFLKGALEQLSSAIDNTKELKNVTICRTIQDATELIDNFKSDDDGPTHKEVGKPCKPNTTSSENSNKQMATVKAISKINDVLGLIKKFENIQKNISILRGGPDLNFTDDSSFTNSISNKILKNGFSEEEASSLNIFGNLLDKITKLLMPKNTHAKFSRIITDKNMLTNDNKMRSDIMKRFNISLANITVSAKDKLILDYIAHINSNPDCAMNTNHENKNSKSLPAIEGNILLNLSEFFKMKSFADLVNLLKDEKNNKPVKEVVEKKAQRSLETTTMAPVKSTTPDIQISKINKLASTKERLKSHLKSIIEDLIELQTAKGITPKGNMKITDALPCIYNIMNAGRDIIHSKNSNHKDEPRKVVDILTDLKRDMKAAQTRRSDSILPVRPKSAVVLERVLKKYAEKTKLNTRRVLQSNIKPVNELKKSMKTILNISSLYKNQALYEEVPAADKLMLLKALAEDVKNYIIALEGIKKSFKNIKTLSTEQRRHLSQFIVNAAANVTLNAKIIKKIDKQGSQTVVNSFDRKDRYRKPKPLAMLSGGKDHTNYNEYTKITRNQIINHLIKNRVKLYTVKKESENIDLRNDFNYNIAKRILFYLENGNQNLAHELFKMLVLQPNEKLVSTDNNYQSDLNIPSLNHRYDVAPIMKPFSAYEEPRAENRQPNWMSQDHLIKQLLNIKEMGL